MDPRENEDQRWERIAKAFFRAPRKPNSLEIDVFVTKVMGRLEPAPSFSLVFGWLEARWTVPALSFSLAALFLSILIPRAEAVAPMDDLLLTDTRTPEAAALLLPPDPPGAEALFSPAMEDK